MGLNRIYNEDCLVGMHKIPDKSIDMIFCDLPYGTTKNEWDVMLPLDELWKQYERIIKDNGAIVLTAQTPFDKILGASNTKLLRYEWIWEKSFGTGHLNANKMPLKSHENILVFYKELPIYNPQFTYGKPYKQLNGKSSSTNYDKQIRVETNNKGYRYPKSVLFFAGFDESISCFRWSGVCAETLDSLYVYVFLFATYVFVAESISPPFSSKSSSYIVTVSPLFALSKNLNGIGNVNFAPPFN